MSKKYIIEIEDAPYMVEEGNTSIALYKAVGFNSLVFDKNGLDKLAPYIADEAYAEGYTLAESKYREARDEVEQEAYQRGLDDAWDAAKKIALTESDGGMSTDATEKMFGSYATCNILKNNTAAEAIEKIRAYEESNAQEDEIRNGDEVCFTIFGRDFKAIAIQKDGFGDWHVLNDRGGFSLFSEADLTKTGRHINLRDLFGGEIE